MHQPFSINALYYRHYFYQNLRNYFDSERFIEVETPILISANTPDPNIDPIFATAQNKTYQLHTSPEVWLKKALKLGAKNIYQVARVFRDDPASNIHAQEFSMLEWYRVGHELTQLICDCQILFACATQAFQKAYERSAIIPEFIQFDLETLFRDWVGVDLTQMIDLALNGNDRAFGQKLAAMGDHLPKNASFEDSFFHCMLKYIEPNLPKNNVSVVNRWPIQLAALSDVDPLSDRYCQRFELYFKGVEIANAYQECGDPAILQKRFQRENIERHRLGKPEFKIDQELLYALSGLDKTAGIALGIDRLLITMMGGDHLNQIILGHQKQ